MSNLEFSDILKTLLASGDMVGPLQMPDGQTSGSLTVATSLPGQSRTDSADWPFQVPSGYVRFSANFEKEHHSGDVADIGWANDNPADGTVHGRVKASQTNGYARVAVSNVYAIKVDAAAMLYDQGLNN